MSDSFPPVSSDTPTPESRWLYPGLLTLAGLGLFFIGLGAPGLMDPDEGRYAEIAREMLVLGDWLVPHLNLLPYLEKPPLVYWLTALSFQTLGLTEFAARLPAALSALGGVLLTYILGRGWWGRRTGFYAALILATCGGYVILGRLIILDMPLTFFLSLGVALGYLAYTRDRRHLLFWAYMALAAAVLVKGPVALALAGLIWGIWTIIDRRRSLLFWLHPAGFALMAVIVLPWFILMTSRYPEFLKFFLWEHHVERFTVGTIHAKPFYYYGPILLGLMMPWGWLLPWAVARVKPAATQKRLFLLIWAGVIIIFFSLSGGKLAPYILPAFLPLALILGESLAHLTRRSKDGKIPIGFRVTLTVWAIAGTALAVLYLWPPARLAPELVQAKVLDPFLPVGLIIMGVTPTLALILKDKAPLFMGAILLCALLPGGMDRLGTLRSPRAMGLALRSHWQPDAALVGVRLYSQSLSFYSRQPFYLLGYPTELDLGRELKPDSGLFFTTWQAMQGFVQGQSLTFFFLRAPDFPKLQERFPEKFEPLAEWKDCLLVAYTGK